ncbi:MAG: hypothetical protein IKO72_13795 [Kiritimatiellae bacterium]|nr:hypothetical protein [Kiritimatiellia bacterium]
MKIKEVKTVVAAFAAVAQVCVLSAASQTRTEPVEVRVRQTPGGPMLFVDGEVRAPRWVYPSPSPYTVVAEEAWHTNSVEFTSVAAGAAVTVQFRFHGYLRKAERETVWLRNVSIEDVRTGLAAGLSGTFSCKDLFDGAWRRNDEGTTGEIGFGDGGIEVTLHSAKDPHVCGDFHISATIRSPKAGRYRLVFETKASRRLPVYPRILERRGGQDVRLPIGGAGVFGRTVRFAAGSGVDFITMQAPNCWREPSKGRSWAGLDSAMRMALRANPNALVVPRIGVDAPGWMLAAHPDLRMKGEKGELMAKSSVSCRWYRKAACEHVEALARHLKETYPRNFAGLHVCGQHTGEWFYYNSGTAGLVGYDVHTRDAFREWLARHGDKDAATAEIPAPEERRRSLAGAFHDPASEPRAVGFARFYQEEIASFISELGAAIRRGTDGKSLAVFFYGYQWGMCGSGAESGHLALDWLIRNGRENVDILAGPVGYAARRTWPGVAEVMGASETMARAGIMWFNEDDTRTYKEPYWDRLTLYGGPKVDKDQTIRTLRRNLAQDMIRGFGCWWMDLFGRGWFDDDDLWAVMREMRPIEETLLRRRSMFSPEIAVVVDERSQADFSVGGRVFSAAAMSMAPFASAGAPYGQYLLPDVAEKPLAARLRVYQLATFLSQTDFAALKADRLANPGRTRVWMWAPGWIGDKGCDTGAIEDLTGFKVVRLPSSRAVCTPTTLGVAKGLAPEPWTAHQTKVLDPVFTVATNDCDEVWATFADGNPAIIVRRNGQGGADVFMGTPRIPNAAFVAALCRLAGVHLYAPPGAAAVWAAEGYVMVQAFKAGKMELDFGACKAVSDALTGERLGSDPRISLEFDTGDVRIFSVVP